MFSHILVGMEQNTSSWMYRDLLWWILIYTGGLLLTGRIADDEIFKKKYCILIRYGNYMKWWRYLFFKIVWRMLIYVFITWGVCNLKLILQTEQFILPNNVKILSLFVLGASWITVAVFQTVMMLLLRNSKISFAFVMINMMISLWGSKQLGELSKWFPLNWEMIIRSDIYQIHGFSITCVLIIEIIILCLMYRFPIYLKPYITGGRIG